MVPRKDKIARSRGSTEDYMRYSTSSWSRMAEYLYLIKQCISQSTVHESTPLLTKSALMMHILPEFQALRNCEFGTAVTSEHACEDFGDGCDYKEAHGVPSCPTFGNHAYFMILGY